MSMIACQSCGTLCWCCGNAYDGCAWSRDGAPVRGWTAVQNVLPPQSKGKASVQSYVVLRCPQFVLDVKFADEFQKFVPAAPEIKKPKIKKEGVGTL